MWKRDSRSKWPLTYQWQEQSWGWSEGRLYPRGLASGRGTSWGWTPLPLPQQEAQERETTCEVPAEVTCGSSQPVLHTQRTVMIERFVSQASEFLQVHQAQTFRKLLAVSTSQAKKMKAKCLLTTYTKRERKQNRALWATCNFCYC